VLYTLSWVTKIWKYLYLCFFTSGGLGFCWCTGRIDRLHTVSAHVFPLDHGRRHSHSFHSFLGWWVHNSNSWLWWKIIKKLFIISWCLPLEGWTWCSAGVSICLPLKFVRFTLAAFVQPYVCALAVHKFHATSLELLAHCFFPDKRLAVCLDLLNGSWTHFS